MVVNIGKTTAIRLFSGSRPSTLPLEWWMRSSSRLTFEGGLPFTYQTLGVLNAYRVESGLKWYGNGDPQSLVVGPGTIFTSWPERRPIRVEHLREGVLLDGEHDSFPVSACKRIQTVLFRIEMPVGIVGYLYLKEGALE